MDMALRDSRDSQYQQFPSGAAGAHYGGAPASGGQPGGYGSYADYGDEGLFSQQGYSQQGYARQGGHFQQDPYAQGYAYQQDPYAYQPTRQTPPAAGAHSRYAYGQQAYAGQQGAPGYQRMQNVYRGSHGGGGGHYGPGGGLPDDRPRKKGNAGLVVAIVLLVVGLALLIGAAVVFINSQRAYGANEQEYTELAEANVTEDTSTGRPVVDFAALQLQNPEIVGWIQIPGTVVNYPVVQHADNDYYLNHSFLDRYDEFGSVFMDYRSASNLSGWNTVMYGHHLQNGNMFARVADYSDQAEFDTLQNLYYVSSDGVVHVLVPLCCMVVNGYDVDSIQFDFADQASFESYVQSLIDRSSARSSTATAAGVNHIYMLSTCSYAQENDRTILVCVDLNGSNGPVVDASQSMNDIQAAADQAAGITDTPAEA